VKVNVTGPVAVAADTLSVIATVGAVLSSGSAPPQALSTKAAARAPADKVNGLARRFMVGTPDWIWVVKKLWEQKRKRFHESAFIRC
jgi:hypothetical protein